MHALVINCFRHETCFRVDIGRKQSFLFFFVFCYFVVENMVKITFNDDGEILRIKNVILEHVCFNVRQFLFVFVVTWKHL